MDMLKEFTKNRHQEERLDAPSLEYLEKEIQWGNVNLLKKLRSDGVDNQLFSTNMQVTLSIQYLDMKSLHCLICHVKIIDFEKSLGVRLITPTINACTFNVKNVTCELAAEKDKQKSHLQVLNVFLKPNVHFIRATCFIILL